MALVTCPECGHNVSEKASVCPNCGYPINSLTLLEDKASDRQRLMEVGADSTIDTSYLGGVKGISYGRYLTAIIINLFVGGAGWLLAPHQRKRLGILFFILFLFLWQLGRGPAFAIIINIISAIVFSRRFTGYVIRNR